MRHLCHVQTAHPEICRFAPHLKRPQPPTPTTYRRTHTHRVCTHRYHYHTPTHSQTPCLPSPPPTTHTRTHPERLARHTCSTTGSNGCQGSLPPWIWHLLTASLPAPRSVHQLVMAQMGVRHRRATYGQLAPPSAALRTSLPSCMALARHWCMSGVWQMRPTQA